MSIVASATAGWCADAPTSVAASQLSGRVMDPSGATLPSALVWVTDEHGITQSATADASGRYAFNGLAEGTYTLAAEAAGFARQSIPAVRVQAGRPLAVDLKLVIETAQQNLEVTQSAGDASPASNADAIVLKGSGLDMLSTDTNQMQQELQAMTGATGDGAGSLYVDGFSNGRMPPKNTIREIRINQNPVSAEYEEQGSNRIEVFTKPGSDTLHAEAKSYGTASGIDTRNPYSAAPQPFHAWNIEADANGPMGKKTSFLAGIRLNHLANIAVVNAEGLDAENNQTPVSAVVDNPTDYNGFSFKLDRQLGTANTLTARVDYGHQNQQNASVGQLQLASQGYGVVNNFTVLQLGDTQVYGPKIVNETRFQYQRSRSTQTPVSSAPALVVEGAFTGGGSDLGHITDHLDQYEFQNYATVDLGKHLLRAGIRERVNREANNSTANYNGEYIFATLAAYQLAEQQLAGGQAEVAGASQFNITAGDPAATVLLADTAVFAEDTWKLTKKFTATFGLRFESQNHLVREHDFAPRFGSSYSIGGTDKKAPLIVWQTGFGIFYDRFPVADVLQAARLNGHSQYEYVVAHPGTYPAVPAAGELGGVTQLPSTLYRIGNRYRSPYDLFLSTSAEHSFGTHGSATVGFRGGRGEHLLLSRNINAPLPGTYDPSKPSSGVRPLGTLQNIYEYDTEGLSNRTRVYTNVTLNIKMAEIYANYSFGHRRSDTSGNFPMNQYDVHQDYGRDVRDSRHRLFLGESFHLPYKVTGGMFMIAESGTPFDIVLGNDQNGDSQFNDRPSFATDLSRTSVVRTRYGNFDTSPTAGQQIIPHNYAQGPGFLLLNTYWDKSFSFGPAQKAPVDAVKPGAKAPKPEGKYSISGALEVDNLLNHVNPAVPVGTLGSSLFGRSNALNQSFSQESSNRQIYIILGFQF